MAIGSTGRNGRSTGPVLALLGALLLAACGTTPDTTGHFAAEGSATTAAASYLTEGEASWYGEAYHGRTTASGEVYDMHALTAAHRSLPFGTRVRVTNLANGRSLVLTINDRGPFVAGRIIDVSRRAAERLGFLEAGLTKVRVERI